MATVGIKWVIGDFMLIVYLRFSLMFADAKFVGAFDAADKVYFLLREIAIEQINCAKVVDLTLKQLHNI